MNFLFNPYGRVSRLQIWLFFALPQLAFSFAASVADASLLGAAATFDPATTSGDSFDAFSGQMLMPFSVAVSLFYFWPNIAVAVKRFHDRGMTGWWVLWFALILIGGGVFMVVGGLSAAAAGEQPGVGILPGLLVMVAAALTQFVILYCLPGKDGPNKYGDDPREGPSRKPRTETRSAWAEDLLEGGGLAGAAAGAPAAAGPRVPPAPTPQTFRNRGAAPTLPPGTRPAFGRRGA
jgi:uncharacterized membrane protein YhaH (DUF805 family)